METRRDAELRTITHSKLASFEHRLEVMGVSQCVKHSLPEVRHLRNGSTHLVGTQPSCMVADQVVEPREVL